MAVFEGLEQAKAKTKVKYTVVYIKIICVNIFKGHYQYTINIQSGARQSGSLLCHLDSPLLLAFAPQSVVQAL
jgi:hypothetical protein